MGISGCICVGQHWTLSAVCRCIANIKDECAHDNGGCWREDFTVNGRTQTYSCQCPLCFTEFQNKDGSIYCKPKCDLDSCDEKSGICQGTFSGTGGARPSVLLHVSIISHAPGPAAASAGHLSKRRLAMCTRL